MGVDTATGSLLAAMAGVGVFRLGGTIVGPHVFRLYEGEHVAHADVPVWIDEQEAR